MVDDSKFYRLRKLMDLQAEIDELAETTRLLKRLESRYEKRGKKRLITKLSKAQESLDTLKETLQQNFQDGMDEIKSNE